MVRAGRSAYFGRRVDGATDSELDLDTGGNGRETMDWWSEEYDLD